MIKRSSRLLVLTGILIGLAVYLTINFDAIVAPLRPVEKPKKPLPFETDWQKEDHWIIQSILTDIYGMLAFQADSGRFSYDDLEIDIETVLQQQFKGLKNPKVYQVEAAFPKTHEKIILKLNVNVDGAHLFAPQLYWDWTRTLIDLMVPDLPASFPSSSGSTATLAALLTPTSEVIAKESERLSRELEANSIDPYLHLEAALLVGMMSMRETAGMFTDLRPNLCRSTAHLAIANALLPFSQENPLQGIALAVHNLHLDHQLLALDGIDALDATMQDSPQSAVYTAWKDALYTRITGDWRVLKQKPGRTLFENMELFGALCRSISPVRAIAWIREAEEHNIPFNEAARVAADWDYNVSSGHLLLKNSVNAELQELANLFRAEPFLNDFDQLVAFLNQTGSSAVAVDADGRPRWEVISKGAWGAYFQRVIMHRILHEYRFYSYVWGVEDRARAFYAFTREQMSRLKLYPVYMRVCATDPGEMRTATHLIQPVIKKAPETITLRCANVFRAMKGEKWRAGNGLKYLFNGYWYVHAPLPGTVFDIESRMVGGFVNDRESLNICQAALKVAPYQLKLIAFYQKMLKEHGVWNKETFNRIYAPFIDYNLGALNTLSELNQYNPDIKDKEQIDLYRRICEIDPDQYFELGEYLARAGRKEEAARAYQQGVDKAIDRVLVANKSEWLVFYYYHSGEKEKALEVAEAGAAVGSYSGFHTMAQLCEKIGDLKGTEKYYRKIAERYGDPTTLIRFFQSNPQKASFKSKRDELIHALFPEGLQTITLNEATGAPKVGLVFVKSERWMSQYGLKQGDIIIAVNGYRIQNKEQFLAAGVYKNKAFYSKMIVWENGRYHEVTPKRKNIYIIQSLVPYTKSGV